MRRFLAAAGFGFAALSSFACTGGVTEQEGPRLHPGGSGGQGGSAGAGAGGGLALGGAGSGGMSGGTSDGADAGRADAGALEGEFAYPAGCPVPNPVGIPGQKIAIQSFNFETSELVLKNISATTQVIVGQRLGWQWCSFPSYWNIAPQGDVSLPPGKTYKFILVYNTQGTWLLPQEGGELAIYIESGTFDEPEKMVSFVSWGTGLAMTGREYVATLAGLWTLDSRIEVDSADAGFIATGSTKLGSGYQVASKRCLVAPPNQ